MTKVTGHIKRSWEKMAVRVLLFIIGGMLYTSCSVEKGLQENEKLYTGHDIVIQDKKMFEKWGLEGNIDEQIVPEPNRQILGLLPMGLHMYNMIGDVPDSSFRGWIQRKMGQPPVIYKPYYTTRSENNINNFLYSNGYFNASSLSEVKVKNKKVSTTYTINLNQQYKIDTISYPEKKDTLTALIQQCKKESLLKKGQPYNLQRLKDERLRISQYLRNHGYYFFTPDYLLFELDSNRSKASIKVALQLKENIPAKVLKPLTINNIYVHGDQNQLLGKKPSDTVWVDSIYFFNNQDVNPNLISRSIMFRKGDLYKYDAYVNTLHKLSGLGVYKFTNINYKVTGNDSSRLNAHVFITRSVPISLRMEIQAVSKSNDYVGPEIGFNYRDRNLLNNAELFTLNLNTSFETQISKGKEGGNSYEIGAEASLSVPRFIFPIVDVNRFLARKYTPKTNMKVGYNFHFRTLYFQMNNLDLAYSYNWRETATNTHDFKIININFSRITKTTEAFEQILEEKPLIEQSFNEQLIFSLSYTFTYNNQLVEKKRVNTYFSINPEIAGNTFSLYHAIVNGNPPSSNDPANILGVKYSQYARVDADFRTYFNVQDAKLAGRFVAGVGKAYGNSEVLPYVKQFYIGGATDIRAFRSHEVGPGSFVANDSVNAYFEQVGDIKLMANLEYRFNIYRFLKGAIFLDAGNVWLLREQNKPGGLFSWKNVLTDAAVGTGFGLRVDANLFVLRFDLGIPLHKPWLEENKWVHQDINFNNRQWRKDNLVFNVAIGYPF